MDDALQRKSPWSTRESVSKMTGGSNTFKLGDIVVAKLGDYPFWPATISRCDWETPATWRDKWKLDACATLPERLWCTFFGDGTVEWVAVENIRKFVPQQSKQYIEKRTSPLGKEQIRAFKEADAAFASRNRAAVVHRGQKSELQLGSLVMAKLGYFPHWPAIISYCFWSGKQFSGKWIIPATSTEGARVWVVFIGEDSGNWVLMSNVERFSPATARRLQCAEDCSFFEEQMKSIELAKDIFRAKSSGSIGKGKQKASKNSRVASKRKRVGYQPWVEEDYARRHK